MTDGGVKHLKIWKQMQWFICPRRLSEIHNFTPREVVSFNHKDLPWINS